MKRFNLIFFLVFLSGCAGWSRQCSTFGAENFGSDWVVAQYDLAGRPFKCWELRGVSIANEEGSDGIYWKNPQGNLVHISGLYNRIQVNSDKWDDAYAEAGVTKETCEKIHSRKYVLPEEEHK